MNLSAADKTFDYLAEVVFTDLEWDRIPAFPKNYGDEQMLPSAQPAVENKTLNSGVPHPNTFSFLFSLLHLDGFRVLFSSRS